MIRKASIVLFGILLLSTFAVANSSIIESPVINEKEINPIISEDKTEISNVTENTKNNIIEEKEKIHEETLKTTEIERDEKNIDALQASKGEIELSIKQWYPKEYKNGVHYVFICKNDISATEYDWYFGDGHKLLGINNIDVYHIYEKDGEYKIRCVAKNSESVLEDSLVIKIKRND